MEYEGLIRRQKAFFKSGKTMNPGFRVFYLGKLLKWMEENEERILKALKQDLGRSGMEEQMTGIGLVKEEIRFAMKHLAVWGRPKKVRTSEPRISTASFIYREPYGVVLIMAPWNYPFQLIAAPLIGAISAGNCAVLKLSSYSVHTSAMIREMIQEVFPASYVTVVTGGREESEALLTEKFDYISFTGSPKAGRSVMEKAAGHLTPVSLELGGKRPCIVDETADLKYAARKIAGSKFFHAGQTGAAPDYVLVQHSVRKKLIHYMEKQIQKMYGASPLDHAEYASIINQRHFKRICGLIDERKVIYGGRTDSMTLKIEPTLMDGVTWDDAVMKEEIFGPVLPIMSYYDLKEAAEAVDAQSGQLALYLFAKDRKQEELILKELSGRKDGTNDNVIQLAMPYLPPVGAGQSGLGKYHGKAGFDLFTREKTISRKSPVMDIWFRHPALEEQWNKIKKYI